MTFINSSCFFALMVFSVPGFSQSKSIDSLQKILFNLKDDTVKANTYNNLSMAYYYSSDYENSLRYAGEELALSVKLDYKTGQGNAFLKFGNAYIYQNKLPEAFKNYYSALNIFESIKDTSNIAATYADISLAYTRQDNYPEALRFLYLALKMFDEIGNERLIGICKTGIGDIYLKNGNYSEAEKNYTEAKELITKTGDQYSIALNSTGFGNLFLALGNYSKAIERHEEVLKYFMEINAFWDWANTLSYIGNIYEKQGQIMHDKKDKSLEREMWLQAQNNYKDASLLFKKDGDKIATAVSYFNLGNISIKLKKFQQARNILIKSLQLSKEINGKDNIKNTYLALSVLDSISGNISSSFLNYKRYILYHDSLLSEEGLATVAVYKMQYEYNKKEVIAKAEQNKKDILARAELSRQRLIRNFSLTGIVVLLVFGGYILMLYSKRKKLNNELSHSLMQLKKTQQQLIKTEREKEAEKIRLNISRDLHDDLGATLSSISVYSIAAKQRLNDNKIHEAGNMLERISTDAQEMAANVSERVWMMKQENSTIEKLIEHLQLFASSVLTAKNISFQFDCDEKTKLHILNPDARKNIYLIFKEAINNGAKYSEGTEVKLNAIAHDNELSIILSDNGKGFDQTHNNNDNIGGGNNGLRNMKERSLEINAQLQITSSVNNGTSINFSCLLPIIGMQ